MLELAEIQTRLADYLDASVLSLKVLASGWETTVFEFTTAGASSRFPAIPIRRPLVLRFYQGPFADPKGARENFNIAKLSSVGFSVPRPYGYEPSHEVLGAPFLIMERLAGGPLFSTRSFPTAFKTFSLGFFGFVRAQVRLHHLDLRKTGLDEIPRAFMPESADRSAPLLDRMLKIIEQRVVEGPLPGLKDAHARLAAQAAQFRTAPLSVVHMDYHPQNVLVQGIRVNGVIDWVNTDIGDRHLDAAMTAAILSSSAMEHPRWMRDNVAGNSLRTLFTSLYVPLYHAMAPLDFERFRYCQAVASLLRLSMLGMMRTRGAETVGFRPEAIGEVTPAVVRLLSRYAARKSGAQVGLDQAKPLAV
ncbi:MAG TPA: phosphotransferase [Candidatus Binataceae bacterium]|nr:phosphotransferase [Candidatus Binataceae bacterium]